MAMGKRKRHAKQSSMWVATEDLPRSAAHPFYTRLNQILDQHDFDRYVEELCQRFYADDGRPGLPPGRYFRLLLIGYFEGLDAERAIAWRPTRRSSPGCCSDWRTPAWSRARPSVLTRRRWKRMRRCEALCGATPVRAIRTS